MRGPFSRRREARRIRRGERGLRARLRRRREERRRRRLLGWDPGRRPRRLRRRAGSRGGVAARSRARGGLYHVQDLLGRLGGGLAAVGGLFGRIAGAIASGWRGFWGRLSIAARRRLVVALGAGILLVLFLALAVPSLPCQLPGGDSCPPPDDAEEIVPAETLAYLHLELDPETEQAEAAAELARRLPRVTEALAGQLLARLPVAGSGAPADFLAEIEPWFAGEAASAVIPGAGGRPTQVLMLEYDDEGGARAYAERLAAGRPASEDYQGVELREDERGLASATVEGFLVLGTGDGVRDLIDVASGEEGSAALAEEEFAGELRDELPDQRLAELYLSADGLADLAAAGGALEPLAPLLAPESAEGAAVALAVDGEAFELAIRALLDPDRAEARPSFFAAFPRFDPSLDSTLPERTAAYLGLGDPQRTVSSLLAQATTRAPAIVAGFDELVATLRREARVDVEREFLAALDGEAAFTLGLGGELDPSGAAADRYLGFVADEVDEERALRALAALQKPLADSVDPSLGQAPVFGEREIAGVEARSLRLSPTIELTYAAFDGLVALASDPLGIEELRAGGPSLDDAARFEAATDGLPDEVSLLAFLDLRELVALGERVGLSESPAYAEVASDARSLEAFALAVRSDPERLASDARLVLGEPPAVAPTPVPGAGD